LAVDDGKGSDGAIRALMNKFSELDRYSEESMFSVLAFPRNQSNKRPEQTQSRRKAAF
jgi:hypothetical protein